MEEISGSWEYTFYQKSYNTMMSGLKTNYIMYEPGVVYSVYNDDRSMN